MKSEQVIEKMKTGCKLFRMKTFVPAGNTLRLSAPISKKDRVYFYFEDGTKIHHLTGKSMTKSGLIKPGDSERTLGGTKTEMKLAEK